MARRNEPSPNRMKWERHSLFTERTHCSAKVFRFGLRGGSRRHFTPPGCQGLPEVRAELGVAVVQHIAMLRQISRFLVHRVAGHLGHPLLRGMAVMPAKLTRRVSRCRKNKT